MQNKFINGPRPKILNFLVSKCISREALWLVSFRDAVDPGDAYSVVSIHVVLHRAYERINHLGDNRIQNVHLGKYIVGYMVGSFVLRRRVSGAVKRNFRPYNRWYTSRNNNILDMVIPILMHFLTFIRQRHSILHQTEASSAT